LLTSSELLNHRQHLGVNLELFVLCYALRLRELCDNLILAALHEAAIDAVKHSGHELLRCVSAWVIGQIQHHVGIIFDLAQESLKGEDARDPRGNVDWGSLPDLECKLFLLQYGRQVGEATIVHRRQIKLTFEAESLIQPLLRSDKLL